MDDAAAAQAARSRSRALRSHRFSLRLALSAGNVFAWILAFRALYAASGSIEASLAAVLTLYALSQMIVFVLTPLSGAALRHGMRRALLYGTLSASFAFTCMALAFAPAADGELSYGMIASFVILMGLHRGLYWVPYRTEIETAGAYVRSSRGEELLLAGVPLLAGLIIDSPLAGPAVLEAAVALCILASLVPLVRVPESYEGFSWGFLETYQALFSPFNRGLLSLSVLDGVQGAALLLLWPLAAFIIIGQSFTGLGFILALTLAAAPFARIAVRRYLGVRSTGTIAALAFSSWIFRLAAASPIQILAADLYHQSAASPKRFSIDAPAFDQLADGAHYVDEYTALKELGLALGRIIACLVAAAAAIFIGAAAAFAIALAGAGIAAASSVFLSRRMATGV